MNPDAPFFKNDFFTFVDFIDINDCEKKMIWQWRNHENIRKWMYNKNIICLNDHLTFINDLKSDTTKKYWLVKRNNINIGVFSIININDKIGEWGYYIAPELHEKNLGVEFYYFTLKFLFDVYGMKSIYGYALIENIAANSLNDLFGFTKKLFSKTTDNQNSTFYYRELTFETWKNIILGNKKIERLLLFTLNKIKEA